MIARVRKHTYYVEFPVNKRWVKRLTSYGRASVLKWCQRAPLFKGRSLVKYFRDRGYTEGEIASFWVEAVVVCHLLPNYARKPLHQLLAWRYTFILRTELKQLIEREQMEKTGFDFARVPQ